MSIVGYEEARSTTAQAKGHSHATGRPQARAK
jgi:hypothetical protein